ncbi:uncharacterized protein LOC134289674 [Aedes albopictus]|uniref:Uncharacterized protein n=1 Tax=Aedes albopictus TaxID=7160 RepID=A0ABM1Y547_AEDAL
MATNARTSFYTEVRERYGAPTVQLLKLYANNNTKLGNMQSRKEFLLKCRRNGVVPSHILHSLRCTNELLASSSPCIRKLSSTVSRFQKSLLNIEIQDTCHRVRSLNQELDALREQIVSHTDRDTYAYYFLTQEFAYHDNLRRKSKQTARKYSRLMNNSVAVNQSQLPTENSSAVLNATNKTIPPETLILLSLGPKFALPYTNIAQMPFFHLIADVENILAMHTDIAVREQTRCQIINKTQNFVNKNRPLGTDPLEKFCRTASNITKKFIKTNPDILITEADKGNRTVIMHLDDYESKMAQLIGDTSTYQQVNSDPTSRYERGNNNITHKLQRCVSSYIRTAEGTQAELTAQASGSQHNISYVPFE